MHQSLLPPIFSYIFAVMPSLPYISFEVFVPSRSNRKKRVTFHQELYAKFVEFALLLIDQGISYYSLYRWIGLYRWI